MGNLNIRYLSEEEWRKAFAFDIRNGLLDLDKIILDIGSDTDCYRKNAFAPSKATLHAAMFLEEMGR